MSASLGPQVGTGTSRRTIPGPADSLTSARMRARGLDRGNIRRAGQEGLERREAREWYLRERCHELCLAAYQVTDSGPGEERYELTALVGEHSLPHAVYTHRADLELGNFGVWIQPWIG